MSFPSAPPPISHARRRRNPRPINSCTECRLRKSKCSRSYPCRNCTLFHRECVFLRDPKGESKGKGKERGDNSVRQQSSVEHEAPPPTNVQPLIQEAQTPPRDFEWEAYQQDVSLEYGWDNLVADPQAMHDGVYIDDDDDEDGMADMTDTTLRIGKMVITERIGGLFRPQAAKQLGDLLVREGLSESLTPRAAVSSFSDIHKRSNNNAFDFFSGVATFENTGVLLPLRLEAEILYYQYLQSVHPVAHILHIPSFKRMFDSFWNNADFGRPNSGPRTALILAVCMSAACSMSTLQTQTQFGIEQEILYNQLKASTEAAFRKWNCLSSSSIQCLQAFTLYLITECRTDVSRSHSILVGALIRLAQCIGIHRKNSTRALSPVQQHVRSLLWYHICYLDLKTSELQGPQPTIRSEDFDIPVPLNVDDAAFEISQRPTNAPDKWTDTTFSLLRFEFNEIHRVIFNGRVQIDRNKMSLQQLRLDVDAKKTFIEERYLSLVDVNVPIQLHAQLFAKLMFARCDAMMLYRYLPRGERSQAELQLRDIVVEAALTVLECGATLETAPSLQAFAWYAGAYQQYHSALPILAERYLEPRLPQSARIARILDHTFGPCYGVDLTQRCRDILWRIKQGLDSLYEVRKVSKPKQPAISENSNENNSGAVSENVELPIQLSEAELDELFQSFQTGVYQQQEPFMFGFGDGQQASQFTM